MTNTHLLADVGGTNTRVAQAQNGVLDRTSVQRFRNDDFPDLYSILKSYAAQSPMHVNAVCVDIAGPVQNGAGELTNRVWQITPADLCTATGAKNALVINDMQAQGLALSTLPPSSLKSCVTTTTDTQSATKLVVNVGTGFNSAVVLHHQSKVIVPGSETGHMDLPSATPDLFALHQFITERNGFASVEDVLSGRGISQVYAHFSTSKGGTGTKTSQDILATVQTDPIANQAVATTVRVLGQICGNLALSHLPFSGVFLVGGMAQALQPHFASHGFADAFRAKGRFSDFMQQFSVTLVDDDHAPPCRMHRRTARCRA